MELIYAVPCFIYFFFLRANKIYIYIKKKKAEVSFFHTLIWNLENAQRPLNKSCLFQIQKQRPLTDMHQYFSKTADPLIVTHLHLSRSQKSKKKNYSKHN